MREQPRQIYTSVRSQDNTGRVSPLTVRIVVMVSAVVAVAVVLVGVLGLL